MVYPIRVNNLNWSFNDNKILTNITTKISNNSFTCIIGPNGSGKSTFLKGILKILPPKQNTIHIENEDITKLNYRKLSKKIASVPQNTTVDYDFSVMDIVLMGRSPYIKRFQAEKENDFEIAKQAMEMTSTWHLKDRSINSLSGGERQRVIISRALAQQSNILVLDEPISHLDIHHQVEVLNITKELCTTKNFTVIAVLHDLNLAIQYSDYLILINKGHIVAEGSPEEVVTKENIKNVYSIDICMITNPVTGKPHIIPITK